MKQRIAQVVIDINHSKLDRVFDYLIPESLSGQIGVGMPVRVPFGKGNVIRTMFRDIDADCYLMIDGDDT